MAAKKKATKRAKSIPAAPRTSRSTRPALNPRPSYNRKAARSEKWSPEWLALFDAYGGQLVFSVDVLKLSRQTITRWGLWGDPVPETAKMLIRMYAAAKGLRPPV